MRFKPLLLALGALVGAALSWSCSRGTARRAPPRADGAVGRSVLGGHALLVHDQNKGVAPATTPPITTQPQGSTLLAVSMGRNSNFVAPTDSYHNDWSPIGRRNPYAGGRFYTAMWSSAGARGGGGHTLSATKPSDPVDEISLAFIEIANGGAVTDTAYAYPKAGSPNTPGRITTGGPATLIAVWGGDGSALAHTAVPSDGFQVIDSYLALGPTSGVQIAIAARQVEAAGTYTVTWTATPAQGAACYLIAVE